MATDLVIVLLVSRLSAVGKCIKYMCTFGCRNMTNLVVGCTKAPAPLLVVKHLNLEGEILLQLHSKLHKDHRLRLQFIVVARTRRTCELSKIQ